MVKIIFTNEENLPEIVYSERIFVDAEAPTNIVICVASNYIRLRLRFSDVEEVSSFMEILFECDKINLIEIAKTAPNLEITVEEESVPTMMGLLDGYLDGFDDEYDPTEDSDYGEQL